jgi:hypothetical protein
MRANWEAVSIGGRRPKLCKNAKICVSPKIFPTSTQELGRLAIAGNTGGYAFSLN